MWEKCGGFEVPDSRFSLSWLSLLTVYCIFLFLSQRMEKDYHKIDYECLLGSDKALKLYTCTCSKPCVLVIYCVWFFLPLPYSNYLWNYAIVYFTWNHHLRVKKQKKVYKNTRNFSLIIEKVKIILKRHLPPQPFEWRTTKNGI